MTLCSVCKKEEATIYFKSTVNDQVVKLLLCEECARKKGMELPVGKNFFSLGDLVASLTETLTQGRQIPPRLECGGCGLTYQEFREKGRFGCSQCYLVFSSLLPPLFKRIHGAAQHVGKPYKSNLRAPDAQKELKSLQKELEEALQTEQYEKAAELRDRIRSLEARSRSTQGRTA